MNRITFLSLLVSFFAMCCGSVYAQSDDAGFADKLESARKLYFSGSYYAAEGLFNDLSKSIPDDLSLQKMEIEAYKALCSIVMNRVNAEGVVKTFVTRYPNSPQVSMVKYALGLSYFEAAQYAKALEVLDEIKIRHLDPNQQDEFIFKLAFCNMRLGCNENAERGFRKLLARDYTIFTNPGVYYLAYVYYTGQRFREAVPLFERACEDSRFSLMSSYYLVESKFMLHDYDYVTEHGESLLNELEPELQANLARMMSESYYAGNKPELASKYLNIYKESGASMSRKDNYFSGILSYSLKDYKSAVESFARVFGEKDSLSQNALYYSANSQLKLKNKLAALESFREASEFGYDPVIKEDAMFNYAKLAFDVNSDISQFERFQSLYPKSGKQDVINKYMATSFLRRKDYASAVEALVKIRKPDEETLTNLQKAAFLRAMQLVESGSYRSAIPLFQLSARSDTDDLQIENMANFWLAECFFRDEKYKQAENVLKSLLSGASFRNSDDYNPALFNMAYSCFMQEDFAQAAEWFVKFLNVSDDSSKMARDARIRLADSRFMQGLYSDAAKEYEFALGKYGDSEDMYPALQGAVAYGLAGDNQSKISLLKGAIRQHGNAPLYPEMLYELGRTYELTGNDADASECFLTLLGMKEKKTVYLKSLLELAMISRNAGKNDRAVEYYKSVVTEDKYSKEAKDALAGMESVYTLDNRPEEYLVFIDEVGLSGTKSEKEKEEMLFSSAEQLYLSGKYTSAVNSLQTFIATFPSGEKAAQANLYLAESLFRTGRKDAAADAYQKAMSAGTGACLVSATRGYADLNMQLGYWSKSAESYGKLIAMATDEQTRVEAYLGRSKSYYMLKQYRPTVEDADRIIPLRGNKDPLGREARFLKAKSCLVIGNRSQAMDLFGELSSDCSDSFGAESTYRLILDAYDAGRFADVESKVYAFSDSHTDQMYWLASSFIILGDSFADRDDFAQARATFESIRDGYTPAGPDDDIIDQVNKRLEQMKTMGK